MLRRSWTKKRRSWTKKLAGFLIPLTVVAATLVAGATATASVTAVKGSAYGYFLSVSLFGGPQNARGPAPTVTLPASGSNGPVTATAPSATAVVGPATFFTSGQLNVSTQGTVGPSGSVTSSTNIANITTTNGEPFGASNVTGSCTTSSQGTVSGTTTITGGTLTTDSGYDINGDGDFIDAGEHAPVTVPIPANPAPNTLYSGHIHVNGSQDNFTYTFNERVTNPDGSLTVYAAHENLTGPTAVGNLFIGKAECGLTGTPDTTTTSSSTSSSTSTTLPTTSTTSTTLPTTSTTSTTLPASTTTTTLPSTTTTTLPPSTTTTTLPTPTTTSTTTPITSPTMVPTGTPTVPPGGGVPPTITITGGPSGLVNTATPVFTFQVGDLLATLECRFDAAPFGPCSGPGPMHTSPTSLGEGAHTFEVRARLGSRSAASSRTFAIDTIRPALTLTRKPRKKTTKRSATFAFTSEAGAAFICRLDGRPAALCSSPRTLSVRRGRHTFTVQAADAARNLSASTSYSWKVIKKKKKKRRR